MKRFKPSIFLTLMFACILIMTSCGAGQNVADKGQSAEKAKEEVKETPKEEPKNEDENKAEADSGQKSNITFWSNVDETTVEKIKTKVIPELLEEINVEFVTVPYNEYEKKLKIAINGGSAPDVFYVDGVYTANYAYMGALQELNGFWADADFNDYVDSSKDKCSYNGKIYAASLNETSCVLYYNKDHFEAAGITDIPEKVPDAWTYEKLIDAAVKCTIKDNSGKIVQYGLLPGMGAPDLTSEGNTFTDLLWLWNFGGEMSDPGVKTSEGYFNSDKSKVALQAYQDLFQKSKVAPLETITQGFETGLISMMIHSIGMSSGFNTNFPDLNYGVMPLPVGENNYSTSGGWNIAMSAQCEDTEAAWKLIDSITGKDGHKKWCETFNQIPSRKSVIDNMPTLQEYPMNIAAELTRSNPRARPITPAYAEISTIIVETFNSAAYGEDVNSTADNAVKKIDKIIGRYPE